MTAPFFLLQRTIRGADARSARQHEAISRLAKRRIDPLDESIVQSPTLLNCRHLHAARGGIVGNFQ
jgi:hypothetical protein